MRAGLSARVTALRSLFRPAVGAALFVAAVLAAPHAVLVGTAGAIDKRGESVLCEIGTPRGWSVRRLTSCDSAEIIEFPRDSGRYGARFNIVPYDPKISAGIRAELRDMDEFVNGDEVWYRFSTLIPNTFPVDQDHSVVLAQWHERVPAGNHDYRPPLAHRLRDGDLLVTLWNDDLFDATGGKGSGLIAYREPGLKTGRFHEFVYRVRWSAGDDGFVHGWKRICGLTDCNGAEWRRIVRHDGPVGYEQAAGYYFKIGIYTVHAFAAPMVVYHKEYSAGRSPQAVGADAPVFLED